MISTLAPANREHVAKRWRIDNDDDLNDEILYDPQTSGGLLIGVGVGGAADLIARLHQAGYVQAQMIGRVIDDPRVLTLRRSPSKDHVVN